MANRGREQPRLILTYLLRSVYGSLFICVWLLQYISWRPPFTQPTVCTGRHPDFRKRWIFPVHAYSHHNNLRHRRFCDFNSHNSTHFIARFTLQYTRPIGLYVSRYSAIRTWRLSSSFTMTVPSARDKTDSVSSINQATDATSHDTMMPCYNKTEASPPTLSQGT